ncbi:MULTISPECIES: hypothetical protein [unclassified Cellulophaga]|uniref:hypothetical protein n=1 Tax=unclassified Cellulophaga TaxID=2634405 RepID=UPI0026E3BEDE|nr:MULTISPECIES: hypothetical protein [unclassified Cellulophaga]MDO6489860.1 hypothetical protein [Cellulophaga sp. 2_MG-2023]MDO6494946.1 hypothetical protein [Cellulophaga sp. 3_MG-2023]
MSADLKKYSISQEEIKKIPQKKGEDSDFKKYSKEGKSTTWVLLVNETMKYLTQVNSKGNFYAGFMPEPYLLFLSNSKSLNNKIKELENGFKLNVDTELKVSENFKLKVLNQEAYNQYTLNKVSSVIFLIMSVESFINTLIPENFEIVKDKGKDTKIEIEKSYQLKEKFREVIPRIKEITDTIEYQNRYSKILQLNRIRNSFIHLKTSSNGNPLDPYLEDFEKLIAMDLDKERKNIELLLDSINALKNVC